MSSTIAWIVVVLVLIGGAIIFWFCIRSYVTHPTLSVPESCSNQSAAYSRITSPYPANPPSLGVGDPVNFDDHATSHRSTRRADPSVGFKCNRAPYPRETGSCYPHARTAPDPHENTASYPSASKVCYVPRRKRFALVRTNSALGFPEGISYPHLLSKNSSYLAKKRAPAPPTNNKSNPPGGSVPYPPTSSTPYPPAPSAPYPSENNGLYPSASNTPSQPASKDSCPPRKRFPYLRVNSAPDSLESSTPCPPASNSSVLSSRNASYLPKKKYPSPPTNNKPYPPGSSVPYPPASSAPYRPEPSAPYPSVKNASYTPSNNDALSSVAPPPSYEEAMETKFEFIRSID